MMKIITSPLIGKLSVLVFIAAFAQCFSIIAADALPAWLQQAAAVRSESFGNDVNAHVLLNDQSVSLDASGKLTTVTHHAVRILSRDGRSEAVAVAFYLSNFSKVTNIEGWLILKDGSVKNYGKKEVVDRISDPDDIYDEGRVKIIRAIEDAEVGTVFGYTTTTEDRPLFFQDKWTFQDDLPTAISKYSLTLPTGWKATSVMFNAANVPPQITENTYSWEMRNLPPIPYEPMSPSFVNLSPRLAVNYSPDKVGNDFGQAFANWNEIALWATKMYDPQVVVDDAIAIKARDLTANAKTELEKISAIGNFVQNMQYISIDIGVGYGNGMRPRASNLVLNRGYGDCKDKANLMRALLKSIKIDSYPIAIYSGDPTYVRKEWASPGQFNHAIIAVKIKDDTEASSVIVHPKLGKLLIFDATDSYTLVGDLPDYLQSSYGLLIAGENGGLIEMPTISAEANFLNRETEVTLSPTGAIAGVLREHASGQNSAKARAQYRLMSNVDFGSMIEKWLTRGATGTKVGKLTANDRPKDNAFDLDVEFGAPNYAQLMQGRLLVFKPTIASRTNSIYLTDKERTHPILMDSSSFKEKVVFKLPAGFVVDEMPNPVDLTTAFGKYSTSYEVQGDKLIFNRTMVTNRTTLPVGKYSEVRDFFTTIMNAEQTPVVLLKK